MDEKIIYPHLLKIMSEAKDQKKDIAEALSIPASAFTLRLQGITDFRKKEIDIILRRYKKKYEDIF